MAATTTAPPRPRKADTWPRETMAARPPRTRIPAEAREGLMRAWLAILGERHPGVAWLPVEREPQAATAAESALLATGQHAPNLAADASK